MKEEKLTLKQIANRLLPKGETAKEVGGIHVGKEIMGYVECESGAEFRMYSNEGYWQLLNPVERKGA